MVEAVPAPIPINLIPGADGIWYDLSIERMKQRLHFRWWVHSPVGWEQAGALMHYLLELSQSTFALSAQRSGADEAQLYKDDK